MYMVTVYSEAASGGAKATCFGLGAWRRQGRSRRIGRAPDDGPSRTRKRAATGFRASRSFDMKTPSALLLASAVTALFLSGCNAGADSGSSSAALVVKCEGINECRGHGKCGGVLGDGGLHGCEGENDCRGRGWIEVPSSECKDKGGSPLR
jgi:hypothetical protein